MILSSILRKKKINHNGLRLLPGKLWVGYLVYVIILGGVFLAHINLSAQPNYYEEDLIKEGVVKEFNNLVNTWKEELYFEMYEFGSTDSKSILSMVEFAQRMVDLRWKPSLNPLKNVVIQIVYRNYATITFVQQFENKINSTNTVVKEMVFPAILEDNKWKFDLTQLINIPYEGKLYKEPVKKEEKSQMNEADMSSDVPAAN